MCGPSGFTRTEIPKKLNSLDPAVLYTLFCLCTITRKIFVWLSFSQVVHIFVIFVRLLSHYHICKSYREAHIQHLINFFIQCFLSLTSKLLTLLLSWLFSNLEVQLVLSQVSWNSQYVLHDHAESPLINYTNSNYHESLQLSMQLHASIF